VIAGAGGVLLVGSLFLTWYTTFGGGILEGGLGDVIDDVGGAVGVDVDVSDAVHNTGWESLEIADVFCVLAAGIAIVRAAFAWLGPSDDPEVPGSLLTGILGAVALAMVAYRIVNPPGVGAEREIGVWVALFAAGAIVYGSFLSIQARRDRPPI
jgi:hypothetical protein